MVADNPDQKITLKAFHAEIINDHEAIRKRRSQLSGLTSIATITPELIRNNYLKIKMDIEELILEELTLN